MRQILKMTLITPDECVSKSADLLRSVQEAILRLRQQAEDLRKQLEAGEEMDLADGNKQLASVDRLISNCHKAELNLAEQQKRQKGIVGDGQGLDLNVARLEIGCRLARLRRCGET